VEKCEILKPPRRKEYSMKSILSIAPKASPTLSDGASALCAMDFDWRGDGELAGYGAAARHGAEGDRYLP
jgi:hypothetical protein